MFSLVKDILNPINWIKLILNPKKIKVVSDRIFYYPGLNFKNIKPSVLREKYKNFLIYFLNYVGKKNNRLNYFFYSNENDENHKKVELEEITFSLDKNKIISNYAFEALKNHGIIIFENILGDNEREKIIETFNKINSDDKDFLKKNKVLKLNKYEKSEDVLVKLLYSELDYYPEIINFSNQVTENIFGKIIEPMGQFLIHKSIKIPETIFPGDNNLHVDRFLPNLKLAYFPFDVENNYAPFTYAIGSHKINNRYKKFFINNKNYIFDERNENSKTFFKQIIRANTKKNSIIITLTNGFHGRAPFTIKSERRSLFLTYPKFNLLTLFSFRSLNKKKHLFRSMK